MILSPAYQEFFHVRGNEPSIKFRYLQVRMNKSQCDMLSYLYPKYTESFGEYENILYLERPGCNLCMGNQEKAAKGDTVLATSTRLFQGRVVEDAGEKKGESLLASTPVVVLAAILGRTPTMDEYKAAVEGIDLTKFAPPIEKPAGSKSAHF